MTFLKKLLFKFTNLLFSTFYRSLCKEASKKCPEEGVTCARRFFTKKVKSQPNDQKRFCGRDDMDFQVVLALTAPKRTNRVRSKMEGNGNFYRISSKNFECFGFCTASAASPVETSSRIAVSPAHT